MTLRITQLVAILPELPARLSLMKAADVAGCVLRLCFGCFQDPLDPLATQLPGCRHISDREAGMHAQVL